MTRSFTYNVVLTKSKDVAQKLFFDVESSGRLVQTRRLSSIYTGLTKKEAADTLLVSPFKDSGFISMINEFPGGGAPRFVTIKFLESKDLLEKFLIPSNAQEELVISRFRKRIRNLSEVDNETLDILRKIRPRFYLSYGIGDDVSEWAGPYIIDLMDANLSITSDGIRELELGFTPTLDTVRVFTNRQFIDQDLSQGQSVFDTAITTSPTIEYKSILEAEIIPSERKLPPIVNNIPGLEAVDLVSPQLRPNNEEGDTWNFVIRRLIRRYLSNYYTTIPEGNVLVLFNQNLDVAATASNPPFNRKGYPGQLFTQLYRDVLAEYGISIHYPKRLVGKKQKKDDVKSKISLRNNAKLLRNNIRLEEINNIFRDEANIKNISEKEFENLGIERDRLVAENKKIEDSVRIVSASKDLPSNSTDTGLELRGIFKKKVEDRIVSYGSDFPLEMEVTEFEQPIDPRVVFGFYVDYIVSDVDSNILESLRPLYRLFSKLKTKTEEAFDPIIFEENDFRITNLLKKHSLIEDETAPVVIVGDRTLIRDLVYSNKELPDLGSTVSYGGFAKVSELSELIPGVGALVTPFTRDMTPARLKASWKSYKKDIQSNLYSRKVRTSSFKEQIDLGPFESFSKSIRDDSVVFMHNLKNSNVLDVSFDASPYKAELLNVANESIFSLLDQGLKDNQTLLDNSLKMKTFDYLKGFLEKKNVDKNDIVRIIDVIKEDTTSIYMIRSAGLDKTNAKDFLDLLLFKLQGNNLSNLVIKNPPGQTAKVAADTLRRASSYILSVDIKTLPFFNTVDFMNRHCVLIGAPNKIMGSKVFTGSDDSLTPAIFSNGYNIFGYKHVIDSGGAYSEFKLYQLGYGQFASDKMSMTTAELLGIEDAQIVTTEFDDIRTPDQATNANDPETQRLKRES